MDNDAISFQQPTGTRPPDRRAALWDELEQLHAQLDIEPPTATYEVEELAEEVALAGRATELPVADRPADIDSLPFDAPPPGGHRRSHTSWRTFSAVVCVGDRQRLRHTGTRHARTSPHG
jgi:hypothetical protein